MGQAEQLWRHWEGLQGEQIPDDIEDFLRFLGGPSVIRLPGRDRTRTRVAVTLLHGNEPSGIKAFHRVLNEGVEPEVDVVLVVASIATALQEPLFSHRFLPEQRDMNRCFKPPFDDFQGVLARELIQLLAKYEPEAVIDLHNTSGDGPAFAVTSSSDINNMYLASLFAPRLVFTDLTLGSLMELTEPGCPVVTIECGGARQHQSDSVAYRGLLKFMNSEHLYKNTAAVHLDIYRNPMRLELSSGSQIYCAESPNEQVDVTLRVGIQRHNFAEVSAGEPLAWVGNKGLESLQLLNSDGENVVGEFFDLCDGVLSPNRRLKLFMVTENAHIASSDCLFYVVAAD